MFPSKIIINLRRLLLELNKIKTYINFLKRSQKIVYGWDTIEAYKKKAFLIIYSDDISNKQKVINKAKMLNCKLFETSFENINKLLDTSNCKIVLIKSYELANAILNENQKINLLREVNLIESTTKQ